MSETRDNHGELIRKIEAVKPIIKAWITESEYKDREPHSTMADLDGEHSRIPKIVQHLIKNKGGAVAVVRCWSRTPETMQALAEQILALKQAMPELSGLVLAINAEGEAKNPTTVSAVATIRSDARFADLDIVPLQISNYHWTQGLNGPTALLSHALKDKGLPLDRVSMIFLSTETTMDEESRKLFVQSYRETGHTLTVKNQDVIGGTNAVLAEITKTFASLPEKSPTKNIHLVNRNTASIFSLKELVDLEGFDNRANQTNGMEDQEFWLRLFLRISEEQSKRLAYLYGNSKTDDSDPYYIALANHIARLSEIGSVPYTIKSRLTKDEEKKKTEVEQNAVIALIDRLHETIKNTDKTLPSWKTLPENQDFKFAK